MARSAMRCVACAGALTTGLLIGGAGVAVADVGDATGAGPEAVSVTTNADTGSDGGATGATNPDPPKSTVGNGREDVDVTSADEDTKDNESPVGAKKLKGSVTDPSSRNSPCAEPPATVFWTALQITVRTLGNVWAAIQPQPTPSPAPGPAFRTQEEEPPVADSGGGGVDPLASGVAAEPPVLRAPMVIAPLPIPLSPAAPPVAPLGAAAGASPKQVAPADVAAAGANTPLIRGSLSPSAEPPARTLTTPMTSEATRLGYPRDLRNPTPGELAFVALPGIAGLMVLTFSGGVIGYRQAHAARYLQTRSAARFLR